MFELFEAYGDIFIFLFSLITILKTTFLNSFMNLMLVGWLNLYPLRVIFVCFQNIYIKFPDKLPEI